jgi:DHA2 family multidrug resistance protein
MEPAAVEWKPRFNPWLIAISVMLATFMEVLDTSVATVALPHIAGNLSATTDEATWVLTSYLISNAIVLPTSGWLGNRFGRKRYQLVSVLVFALASMWCGASTSLGMLIAARVLQGAAGGGLQPVSQAVLLESFPPRRRGAAMAVYGMGIIVAPLVGPLLGGWITDNYSWRWIFYINVPVGMLALFMINRFVEDPPYVKRVKSARIDYIGLGFLAVWLAALQVMLDKGQEVDWFSADWVRWFAVIAVVFLVAFVVRELRTDDPIVDLRVLRDRNLAVGTFLIGLIGVVIYGTTALLPLFLQDLLAYPALQSGIAVAPRGIGAVISMVIAARLVGRIDSRVLVGIGFLIRASSLFMLGNLSLSAGMSSIIWPNIVNGFANGFLFVPLTTMAMETLPQNMIGHGTGLYNLLRNVGASFGISMVATMLARDAQTHQAMLVGDMNPYNPAYSQTLLDLQRSLAITAREAADMTYGILVKQATLLAYVDDFRLLGFLTLICLPFVLLFRRSRERRVTTVLH